LSTDSAVLNNISNQKSVDNIINIPETELKRILRIQQDAFTAHIYPSFRERIRNLDKLKNLLLENREMLTNKISNDFGGRSEYECFTEFATTLAEIDYAKKNLKKWMKAERRKSGLMGFPGTAKVIFQPVGVTGIIAPWNYPIYISVGPLVAAMAAGNRVMIKLSEHTPSSSKALSSLINETFDENYIRAFTGDVSVSIEFSTLPFNHLLYTGSGAAAKSILHAAAENLTPVTLELGGKSPAIIHKSFPIHRAVDAIAIGKMFSAGQSCVAPDYVFCHEDQVEEFIATYTSVVEKSFPTMLHNDEYSSVINSGHAERLRGYISDAIEKGAQTIEINPASEDFEGSNKMPHTLLFNVNDSMIIAEEEIFGPVLIIHTYKNLSEAVDYVNSRPHPLALYYFDYDKPRVEYILYNTIAGGMDINDTMKHVVVSDLPFGGVGTSGMGQYHGREGFLTFSNAKGVRTTGRLNYNKQMLALSGNPKVIDIAKMFLRM